MKRIFSVILLSVAFLGQASAFDKLVVFGDSLSDLGFQDHLGPYIGKTAQWTTPGGKTWPFYLSHDLKLSTITVNNTTSPNKSNQFVSALGKGDDYAAGGAVTDGQGIGSASYVPPSIHQQVINYLNHHAYDDQSNALFVLLGGANDIFEGLSADDPQTAVMTMAKQAADNISGDAHLLQVHGAKHVMVINLPDMGGTPFAQKQQSAQPGLPPLLSAASNEFNAELSSQLDSQVLIFDLQALFNTLLSKKAVTAGGASYQFDNVTDTACTYSADKGITYISAITCKPINAGANFSYLFEDGIHPTDKAHQAVAAAISDFLVQTNRG